MRSVRKQRRPCLSSRCSTNRPWPISSSGVGRSTWKRSLSLDIASPGRSRVTSTFGFKGTVIPQRPNAWCALGFKALVFILLLQFFKDLFGAIYPYFALFDHAFGNYVDLLGAGACSDGDVSRMKRHMAALDAFTCQCAEGC